MARDRDRGRRESDLAETVIHINRVAKVVKGGRRFSFTALVVVGDRKGDGRGQAGQSERGCGGDSQGMEHARKEMFEVPVVNGTIPHEIVGEWVRAGCS